MKNSLFYVLVLASVLPVSAVTVIPSSTVTNTPERAAAAAAKRERHLQRTGGLIKTKSSGQIIYVNCGTQLPLHVVQTVADSFSKNLRCPFRLVEDGGAFSISTASEAMERNKGNAALFLVNDPSLPLSLVAMEAKWAVINAAAILADNPPADVLAKRTEKLLIRTTTVLLGGANSELQVSAMQSVNSVADLDRMSGLGVDPRCMAGIFKHLPTIGVLQEKLTSYRIACKEGWAPPPTNHYQKAVWEQERGTK